MSLNEPESLCSSGGSFDAFVIANACTDKKHQAVVAQTCFFTSSFNVVFSVGRPSTGRGVVKASYVQKEMIIAMSVKFCISNNSTPDGILNTRIETSQSTYRNLI